MWLKMLVKNKYVEKFCFWGNHLPTHYNIGYDASEKWAIKTPHNPAIIEVFPDGKR